MPTERSQQVEQIYHAARERDPRECAAFLEQACAGNDALRREVESLLAEDDGVQNFLETIRRRAWTCGFCRSPEIKAVPFPEDSF